MARRGFSFGLALLLGLPSGASRSAPHHIPFVGAAVDLQSGSLPVGSSPSFVAR